MRIKNWLILAMLALLMACDGQPQSPAGQRKGADPSEATKESTLKNKARYSQAVADKLKDLSAKIAALKANAAALRDEAKTGFDEGVNALEVQVRDLEKRLTRLTTATNRQWETMRKDIEVRLKNLEDTFAQVFAKFSA